ncbi:MAG TPA: hypothetical protein VF597_02115 [Candidatus Saccharimonadales bacterium]|jgi:hypothetical protein
MDPAIFDDMALEAIALEQFGKRLDIQAVIVRNVPTSHTSVGSVFLTGKNVMYALIHGKAALTLGDVRTMIRRMGLEAEAYLPPAHRPKYFDEIATDKFKNVFPGRLHPTDSDLRFYRLSVPYNPALVLISSIPEATIRQFDSSDSTSWRVAAKYAYRKAS